MGASGVRLEECVELYQEESTQRASMRNVNNIDRYCAYRWKAGGSWVLLAAQVHSFIFIFLICRIDWHQLALLLISVLTEGGFSLVFFFLQNCFSDHKKASNLEAYVDWFNRLSYLVATEICMVGNKQQAKQ